MAPETGAAGVLGDRAAVVTGAGRGIGAAIATRFADAGATVAVNDVDAAAVAEVVGEIEGRGGRAVAAPGSVVDEAERIVAAAAEQLGDLDILVNNAGISRDVMVHRMSDEDWDAVLDVVLRGTFNMIRAAAPWLRRSDPAQVAAEGCKKIVNVASIGGIYGLAGNANYSAAKAGVIGLTKSVSREWARSGVCVNAVAPGYIAGTRMTGARDPETGLGMPAELIDEIEKRIPIGRPGRPSDVAEACLWLASPASDYCCGQVIELHGGREIIELV
jgi:3-oxoacyl-[acyl-carrier protein] reductase